MITKEKVKEILAKYLREGPSLLELQNITFALNQIIKEQNKDAATKTFESHGLVWTRHKPGDPMPCKDDDKVCVIYDKDDMFRGGYIEAKCFDWLNSSGHTPITGWRYAEKKIVKIGPSDIPANSIIRFKSHTDGTYYTPTCVSGKNDGVYFCDTSVFHKSYDALMKDCEINRPKHRDADGLCTKCGKKRDNFTTKCEECREKHSAYTLKAYRLKKGAPLETPKQQGVKLCGNT